MWARSNHSFRYLALFNTASKANHLPLLIPLVSTFFLFLFSKRKQPNMARASSSSLVHLLPLLLALSTSLSLLLLSASVSAEITHSNPYCEKGPVVLADGTIVTKHRVEVDGQTYFTYQVTTAQDRLKNFEIQVR